MGEKNNPVNKSKYMSYSHSQINPSRKTFAGKVGEET